MYFLAISLDSVVWVLARETKLKQRMHSEQVIFACHGASCYCRRRWMSSWWCHVNRWAEAERTIDRQAVYERHVCSFWKMWVSCADVVFQSWQWITRKCVSEYLNLSLEGNYFLKPFRRFFFTTIDKHLTFSKLFGIEQQIRISNK